MPPKKKRGRPTKATADRVRRVLITITPADDAYAVQLGNGDRSKGIRAALDAARKLEAIAPPG